MVRKYVTYIDLGNFLIAGNIDGTGGADSRNKLGREL